jgi:PAS domain S-box-containing protein
MVRLFGSLRYVDLLMTALSSKKTAKKVVFKIDRQLRELFDRSIDFKICMLDAAGRIVGWNISAQRMTGYSADEVIGKNYSTFGSKEERRKRVLKRALVIAEKKGSYTAEGIQVRKDGSYFWARSIITSVRTNGRDVKFFVVITRDISQERVAVQKKDEYIGIASHELRNPIQTLSLYSELLGQRLQLDDDKKNLEMLRGIQDQATRLVELLDDLLIVSKIEGGVMVLNIGKFDINLLINHILKGFQRSTGAHKIVFKGRLNGEVLADKNRITQVIINLLTNAVKYSPHADKVTVRVKRLAKKCIVSVQDFGSGISKKDQRQIFTRFFRAEDVGSSSITGVGLGLYISKEILKRHRQRIWLRSSPRGTTFYFTLSMT